VRPLRGRCSSAATSTAPRRRRRAGTRNRRPLGELKPKSASVAAVLPDGRSRSALSGAVRVDREAPRHARAVLPAASACRARRRVGAVGERGGLDDQSRRCGGGQRLDRGAGDARARVELDGHGRESPARVRRAAAERRSVSFVRCPRAARSA
jgi:hypothetical protein